MDKKGIQMGGGQKNTGKKFLYLKGQKQKYQLKSNNLELVTIIECISAAGAVVHPSFCLQNGSVPDLCHLSDDSWGRYVCLCSKCTLANIMVQSLYFSESGWTDMYNCEHWIRDVFILFAKKC